MSTITTVGFGGEHPVTPEGRFVAAGLMDEVPALFAAAQVDRSQPEPASVPAPSP